MLSSQSQQNGQNRIKDPEEGFFEHFHRPVERAKLINLTFVTLSNKRITLSLEESISSYLILTDLFPAYVLFSRLRSAMAMTADKSQWKNLR